METTNHHHDEKQPALAAARQEFLNVGLHPLCWLLSCPFLHCGLCPYRTGKLASRWEKLSAIDTLNSNLSLSLSLSPLPLNGASVLYLDSTAVTRQDVSFCGKRDVYVPYSEIQSIEQSRCCYCVHCVDVQGALGTFSPGTGCDAATCRQTVQALQARVEAHNNLVQERDRRWEAMEKKNAELMEKMDSVLRHFASSSGEEVSLSGTAPLNASMAERRDD